MALRTVCVAGVTTLDGPALVVLALQVEPRRPCGEQKKTRWLGWKILQPQILDSENVTSERPLAIVLTMIRWWEAVRALEGQKGRCKYRIEGHAIDGRNGGAERTVWESCMGMERL